MGDRGGTRQAEATTRHTLPRPFTPYPASASLCCDISRCGALRDVSAGGFEIERKASAPVTAAAAAGLLGRVSPRCGPSPPRAVGVREAGRAPGESRGREGVGLRGGGERRAVDMGALAPPASLSAFGAV